MEPSSQEDIDETESLIEIIESLLKTDKQTKTLKLMLQAKKGEEIAKALGVTPQMVSVYIKQIRDLCKKVLESWTL
jgi:transcriptional regulator